MDRMTGGEADDVLDRVCIHPEAVSRWMQLLEAEGGSPEAVDQMPQERATVEPDGQLKISLEWAGRSIALVCASCEWAWAEGALQ